MRFFSCANSENTVYFNISEKPEKTRPVFRKEGFVMDGLTGYIAQLSMTMAQQRIQSDFSAGMLKNVMDAQEESGAAIMEMLSASSPDGMGTVLDVRA